MQRLADAGQQQQAEFKELDNKMLRLQEEIKTIAAGLVDKEAMVQRLVEEKRGREAEEQEAVRSVQGALADVDEQDKRIQASRDKVAALRQQQEAGVLEEAQMRAKADFLEEELADPSRVRKRQEAEAKLAAAQAKADEVAQREVAAQQALDDATLLLREAELGEPMAMPAVSLD